MAVIRRRYPTIVVIAGIALRLALVLLLIPQVQSDWFAPFLQHALDHPSIDPWQSWLDDGGTGDAFPYGPVMLVVFLFTGTLTSWLPVAGAFQLGVALGVLAIELCCWYVVYRSSRAHNRRALLLFVVSPIVVYAAYIHGQLDLLPSLLLLVGMVGIRDARWRTAGIFIGLSIAAKFSALLVLPLLAVFLLRNERFRSAAQPFLVGLLPGVVLAAIPAFLPGYRAMVLSTPKVESLVAYSISLGPGFALLIAPVVLAAIVVLLWRYRRGNTDLLFLFVALLMAGLPLLVPASPGWFLWAVPLLSLLVSDGRLRYSFLIAGSWAASAIASAATHSWANWRWTAQDPPFQPDGYVAGAPGWVPDLFNTASVAIGIVTLAVVAATLTKRYDRYRLSASPLSVAVAGDSGTGKDTLCRSLADVFEGSSAAFLLGDDYHSYERNSPVWKVKTHLDPGANDMSRLMGDTMQLLSDRPVWSRHYDHERGRFTKLRKVHHGDVVVISGLHVLTSVYIRSQVDLTVFLDMDEKLRTLFKVERDMRERGHDPALTIASMARRADDRERFIQPQLSLAELVLRLESAQAITEDFSTIPEIPPLDVVATLRGLTFGEDFVRAVTSIAGAQAAIEYLSEPGAIQVKVSGTDWITARDVAAVANYLIDRQQEIFLSTPRWLGGSRGVSQLILVLALLERRKSVMELTT